MNELFPAVCGILIGLMYSVRQAPQKRRTYWLMLSLACGIAATIFSSEFRMSWGWLLIDVSLVAGCALAVTALLKYLQCGSG